MTVASESVENRELGFDLSHPDVGGKRVLVVEDDLIISQMIMAVLREMGCEAVGPLTNASAVWESISDCPADLVLMDIGIEGEQDGIDTAAMLREQFSVPVIFLTGASEPEVVARARRVGPLGYLVKPIKPLVLRSAIEMAFWRDIAERELRDHKHWFAATLNSLSDAVITTDPNGAITHMNARAEMLLGRKFAAVEGSRAIDLIKLNEINIDQPIDLLARMRSSQIGKPNVDHAALLKPIDSKTAVAVTFSVNELNRIHSTHINTPIGFSIVLREA